MSAVNLKLATLMVLPGVFFQRQADGEVRIMVTNGEVPNAEGSNLRADFLISEDALHAGMSIAEYAELDEHITLSSVAKLAS